jgi:hypothetical protein
VFLLLLLTFSLVAAPKKAPKMKPPPKIPPGKPEIFQLEPRGIQRGITVKIKLIGTNLVGLTELKLHSPQLKGELVNNPAPTSTEAWIKLTTTTNLARGAYEISVKNTNAESSKLQLYVDDLPQVYELAPTKPKNASPAPIASEPADQPEQNAAAPQTLQSPRPPVLKLPISFWGTLDHPGDADEVEFEAKAGESMNLDLAAKSIGSKANATLALFDRNGALLAANNGFDGGDPLLNFKIKTSGRYRVRIAERTDAGSKDHFYRLSIGTFPVIVGVFPLGVPAKQNTEVELIGFNLPANASALVKAGEKGEMEVPIDPEKFRSRRAFKVVVNSGSELVESEPNDTPAQAMRIPVPAVVNGRIFLPLTRAEGNSSSPIDVDLFLFSAKAGQHLIIETDAARRGSPIDTKIEILHPDGKPVERVLLEAVRDSHLTFKNIDSVTDDLRVENWQEMELNQLMYLQGEVCKIFRMPQGPDSGFQFYNIGGKRREYFDASATAHALDEPTYIVEPHPPGTKLVPNGLPTFTLYYANDDDGDRKIGSDSCVHFIAPADGAYLVRVTDARGHSGDHFAYRLIVREASPDFNVTLTGANPTVNAGSGKQFGLSVDRIDGFDEDIKVEISGLPPGFTASTPVVIQAGHVETKGTLHAAADAKPPSETNAPVTKVTASAMVHGKLVTKKVNNLGKIKLAEKPKLLVAMEPYDKDATNFIERTISDKPLEITIAPGQTIPAWLKIKREGFDDIVTFTVESLPHGVIVDNIGLNGVLIPKDKNERQIFLAAAKWVPEVDRLCFAEAKQADTPTSLPVLHHVRKTPIQATSP